VEGVIASSAKPGCASAAKKKYDSRCGVGWRLSSIEDCSSIVYGEEIPKVRSWKGPDQSEAAALNLYSMITTIRGGRAHSERRVLGRKVGYHKDRGEERSGSLRVGGETGLDVAPTPNARST